MNRVVIEFLPASVTANEYGKLAVNLRTIETQCDRHLPVLTSRVDPIDTASAATVFFHRFQSVHSRFRGHTAIKELEYGIAQSLSVILPLLRVFDLFPVLPQQRGQWS